MRTFAVWGALALATLGPVAIAAFSPWLAARTAIYIAAGFAGIAGLALLLVQPLLAGGYLPGLGPARARWWHRITGSALVGCVLAHVAGLYLTSPQDALDALLLVSPTPFSVYGVAGLWALVLTVLLVALRPRLGMRPGTWRIVHNALAAVVVVGTVVHALMIEGTMGTVSKWALCLAVLGATAGTMVHLRVLRPMRRGR